MIKSIRCPECGGPSIYSPENIFRPFCSERCQLIDLGSWAAQKYAVPGDSAPINDQTTPNIDDSDHSRDPQRDE